MLVVRTQITSSNIKDRSLQAEVDIIIPSLYVIEYLLATKEIGDSKKSVVKLREDLQALKDLLVDPLARTLRDYLIISSAAECRHAKTSCNYYHKEYFTENSYTRIGAATELLRYNHENLMAVCKELYSKQWRAGYGGSKWGKIVEVAGMYGTLPNMVWFDHVVDLQHNGSICFNKGILVTHVKDLTHYSRFLDQKRDHGIGLWESNIAKPVHMLLGRAVMVGVLPKLPVGLVPYKHFVGTDKVTTWTWNLPYIEWGTDKFNLDKTAYRRKGVEYDEDGEAIPKPSKSKGVKLHHENCKNKTAEYSYDVCTCGHQWIDHNGCCDLPCVLCPPTIDGTNCQHFTAVVKTKKTKKVQKEYKPFEVVLDKSEIKW